MIMNFDKKIIVNKKPNNTYTFSIMISEEIIIIRTLTEKDIRQLHSDIENILQDGEIYG